MANASKESDDETDETEAASARHLNFMERCWYIPMRLEHDERRLLRLMEAALNVSEYTDKVWCLLAHVLEHADADEILACTIFACYDT